MRVCEWAPAHTAPTQLSSSAEAPGPTRTVFVNAANCAWGLAGQRGERYATGTGPFQPVIVDLRDAA